MPIWAWWVAAAVVCGIAEMMTPTFFIAWFGVGAVVAAILSALRLGFAWQVSAFIIVSLGLVLSTKRLSSGWLAKGRQEKTNVYALAGKPAVVTQEIPEAGAGQVRVDREIWTALAENGGRVPAGVTVIVVRVDGAHLVVRAPE